MTARWRLPLLVLLGTLVVQAAWILAVPPFGGVDEFDHAYRAAAVARGEWVSEGTPKHGRGGLVTVPADIVRAARTLCATRPTGHDNCNPAEVLSGGRVRVASGASRYNPVFYWVVGTAALPFHGAAALYMMRAVAALLCALGLAVAAWCVSRRSRTRWPLMGLLLGITPVFAYSTVLPAPNGLEMVAGLMLWCALLALDGERHPGDGWVIGWAVAASLCLVTLRSLGPIFAVLIVLCVLVARRRQIGDIWRAHGRRLVTGVGLAAVVTLASVYWILSQSPLGASTDDYPHTSYWVALLVLPLDVFQTIATFPLPTEPAPGFVYVVYIALFGALMAFALRKSRGALRQALVVGLVLSQVAPLMLTIAGLKASVGFVWQGRYGLPFVAGLPLLAGIALEHFGAPRLTRTIAAVVAGAYVLVQATCVGFVIHRELANPVSAGDPGWLRTSTWWVVLLGAAGWTMLVSAQLLLPDRARWTLSVDPADRGPSSR